MPACKIVATLALPAPVAVFVAVAKALTKEYGNDVITWEEPKGTMNFGKPVAEQQPATPPPAPYAKDHSPIGAVGASKSESDSAAPIG